uniref:Coiled-coil domain-containing protein 87 n=1 Tax=Castor canadensis TaxID=51338 RepID=A0A8C0XAL6_CASCN|nr:coiled-coil domain-containing protein 87 [Castor canadensis]
MEPQRQEPEFQRFYHRLLSPLSLFPRRTPPPELPKRRPPEGRKLESVPLAKLRVAPLCRNVARLLASSGLAARVSPKDRLRLTEVILDELKCSWQEPPSEPSLSYGNNLKLRKRLESYVLLCCEQLFLRYLHLLVTMSTSKAVFTESATLTRLAASLARDCTVFLTSPAVYRALLADFQALLNLQPTQKGVTRLRPTCPPGTFKFCPIPWPHSIGFAQVPCSSLNLTYLIHLSRPSEFFIEPKLDPVKELKSIPKLKGRKPLRWLPSIRKEKEIDFDSSQVPLPSHSVTPTSESSDFLPSRVFSWLQRGQSMPSLCEGWKLADEMGLPPLPSRPLTPLILAAESKPELTEDIVAEDLKQKMKKLNSEWRRRSPVDSGLPPLLGVLTHSIAAEQRMKELHRTLKNLQEEEASGLWDLQPPKSCPLQPQPATITLKLRNQVVVQVATMMLSDRNFLDSFHVEGAGVLYNHLNGELDSKVIEDMDIDRFIGSSTTEIYKELMSCVSANHFRFDQGSLIEPTADEDWSSIMSSALLRKEKQFHIINPDLTGFYSQRTNTQQSNPEMSSPVLLHPSKSWEKQANKTSWLTWWKNTVSVDDYFNYLSSQETDYLHVIFHMYEEEVPVEVLVPVKDSLEIPRPPPLLEDEEPDFVPGEWDWSTVMDHRLETRKIHIQSLQKCLERLWSMFEVPDKGRLDMVIKYSSNARLQQLPVLVKAWERVLKPIQMREMLLGRLEWFERQASDPNRFFQKTDLSLSRFLEESQFRSQLHRKLHLVEAPLVKLLEEIELIFGEPVTFKGRRYLDKMKQDRVEMLYWLQQQRRMRHLIWAQKGSRHSFLFGRRSGWSLIVPGNTPTT